MIIAATGIDNLSHKEKDKGGAARDRDGNFYVDTKCHCSLQSPQQEVSRNKDIIYSLLIVPQFHLHASFSFSFFTTIQQRLTQKTSLAFELQSTMSSSKLSVISLLGKSWRMTLGLKLFHSLQLSLDSSI